MSLVQVYKVGIFLQQYMTSTHLIGRGRAQEPSCTAKRYSYKL